MRLWSLHPHHLDPQGLVALWREALLARAVLAGKTRGYQQHPQLERFRAHARPLAAIDAYLAAVHREAESRHYTFDASKFERVRAVQPMAVTDGQMMHEWRHLLAKLEARNPEWHRRALAAGQPEAHPSFVVESGVIAPWERVGSIDARPAAAKRVAKS